MEGSEDNHVGCSKYISDELQAEELDSEEEDFEKDPFIEFDFSCAYTNKHLSPLCIWPAHSLHLYY